MVRMVDSPRKFTPPAKPTGRVRDSLNTDEDFLNGEMEPIPDSFPMLEEKVSGMRHPWNAAMAARPDLVRGVDPGSEREQLGVIDAAHTLSESEQLDAINNLGSDAYGHNPFGPRK